MVKMLTNPRPNEVAESAEFKDSITGNVPWTKAIERAGRGAQFLIEKPSPLSDALAEESGRQRKQRGPIWLGAAVKRDENFKLTKVVPSTLRDGLVP